MYLMSCNGELERADYAIFADTGWEPSVVYEHLERLRALNEIPILTVSVGNLRHDALSDGRSASMPLYTKDAGGTVSMLKRQCTYEYKVRPLQRQVKELGATAKAPAKVWLGISTDEIRRMKDSRVRYTMHRWPLIEQRMDRRQCRRWLEAAGWTEVPKSACIGCPFHDNHYWRWLKEESPAEWQDAVKFDAAIRQLPRLQDETYLHRAAVPLEEAVGDETSQLDLFVGECEGLCGV
jgi:hypothetical protein